MSDWRDSAACKNYDTNIFFPETKETTLQAEPIEICNSCPVKVDCLDYALKHEGLGIWGGLNQTDRSKLRRELSIYLQPPTGKMRVGHPNCGTNAGYAWLVRHNRNKPDLAKEMCKLCLEAHNLYNDMQTDSTRRKPRKTSKRKQLPADKSEYVRGPIF